eukprot:1759431-Pleurochrysis_carterae.AAC.2
MLTADFRWERLVRISEWEGWEWKRGRRLRWKGSKGRTQEEEGEDAGDQYRGRTERREDKWKENFTNWIRSAR